MANNENKDAAIKFFEKPDHYELWFMDEFKAPGTNSSENSNIEICNVAMDLMHADPSKELHIFIWSFGGVVSTLSTLLQLIKRFRRTIAINLGSASSCGWSLFFACDERYAAAHSEFVYHEISCWLDYKLQEISSFVNYYQRRQSLMLNEDVVKYLTEEELQQGKTTEVYITGDEMIKRGGCKEFSLYDKRIFPTTTSIFSFDDKLFKWENGMMQEYRPAGEPVKDKDLIKYKDKD